MARLKKPDLGPGPQKELNDAIHDLHACAGLPSTRELSTAVGAAVASKSRIHDVFSSPRLPAWGVLELLVEALASRTPGGYTDEDERRFHDLWLAALGQEATTNLSHREPHTEEPADSTSTVSASTRELLLVRIEWLNPAAMEMNHRRWLRKYIDQALEDIGHPPEGLHRRDRSAGSLLFIESPGEPAGLLASTLLASLDSAMDNDWGYAGRLVRSDDYPRPRLRFLSHLGSATLSGLNYEGHAVTELHDYWELNLLRAAAAAPGEIAAVVSARVYDSAFFPMRRREDWRPPLQWSHRTVPHDGADKEEAVCLFVREEGPMEDPVHR
ncbi:hypothetical protein [Streptomyces griseorubiginosus]|uniref:hypothetical protein n=1 Tax=Streptomyces griseorubiginosus TaxID=67304 RepID=UPI003330D6E8